MPCGCGYWGGVTDHRGQFWNDMRLAWVLAFLLATPLFDPVLPPLTDVLGHMGRYKVQLDLATSPALQQFYDFNWQVIGNLGVDLLIIPVAALFGIELGVKLIVIATVILSAIGMINIAKQVHGHVPPTAYFALPLILGHHFTFGFINYALSMALAMNAFALWVYLANTGRFRLRAILFLPIGLILWLCHIFGLGFLGILCGAFELVRLRSTGKNWVATLMQTVITCLPLTLALIPMIIWRSQEGAGMTGDWFNMRIKLVWLLRVFRDRFAFLDIASVVIILGVLIMILRTRMTPRVAGLALGAAILMVIFIGLPRILLSSAYADMRLLPFALAMGVLVINIETSFKVKRTIACLAFIFVAVRIVFTTVSFDMYDNQHQRSLAAIDHIPKGARLLSLVGMECGMPWSTHRMEHLPALALVRKQAFSNDQWAVAGAQLLTIKKADAPGFVEDPAQLVVPNNCLRPDWRTIDEALKSFPRAAFDYVWLIKPPSFNGDLDEDMTLIWNSSNDRLYRVNRRPKS
jgi:hypothetical protein